jgi:glycosyltransferase involved in cell wall biosynthesis
MKIIFITGATHTDSMSNLNHFQRTYFLSRQAELTIIGKKGADFSSSTAGVESNIVLSPFGGRLGQLLFGFRWIWNNARDGGYDLILTEPSTLSILGALAKTRACIPWVVDVWDIPIRCQSKSFLHKVRTRFIRMIMKRAFRMADLFLVSMVPDFELKEFNIPKRKIKELQNAIWLDKIPQQNDENNFEKKKILCMRSRYSYSSGLDVLAEAFLDLKDNIPELTLKVVGKIPDEIRSHILPIEGRQDVEIVDFVEHDQLMKEISEAAACVIPYRSTPDLEQIYPVKVLEYLANGTVLVVPNLQGITTMVEDGVNGLVFETGNSKDLSDKLYSVLTSKEKHHRITENARMIKKEHDCKHKAEIVYSYLEQAIETFPHNCNHG